MRVSGQNARRTYQKAWPIIPGLADPVRPIDQVVALEHWEKDLAIYLDAHPGLLDMGTSAIVNYDFEQVPGLPPVGWALAGCNALVVPGSPGGTGLSVGRVTSIAGGVSAIGQGGVLQVGVPHIFSAWVRCTVGATPPCIIDGGSGITFISGIAAPGWQFLFGLGAISPTATSIYCGNTGAAAGDEWEFDNVIAQPLSVITWADRTRRGGRNPTQAVAADRPTMVTAPNGKSACSYDGVSDYHKVNFTLVQPEDIFMTESFTPRGGTEFALDGNGNFVMSITATAGNTYNASSGVGLVIPGAMTAAWTTHQACLDGVNGRAGVGLTAELLGNTGVIASGGVTIARAGTFAGLFGQSIVQQLLIATRNLTPGEKIRMVRSTLRHAAI